MKFRDGVKISEIRMINNSPKHFGLNEMIWTVMVEFDRLWFKCFGTDMEVTSIYASRRSPEAVYDTFSVEVGKPTLDHEVLISHILTNTKQVFSITGRILTIKVKNHD